LPLYALVPAAGRGERFGGPKLLTRWKDREILAHVLVTLCGARAAGLLAGIIVVHRPGDEAVAQLASEYFAYPVEVRDPDGDLSETLRTGIAELRLRDSLLDRSAALVCLADQPMLRLDVVQAMIHAWRNGAAAVRPSYRDAPGIPGHPMLVDRSLWSLAGELRGDHGFGPFLERRGIRIQTVSVAGRNPDIDTTSDLQTLDPKQPVDA